MTLPATLSFAETDLDAIAEGWERVALLVPPGGALGPAAKRVNRLTRGALERFVGSAAFEKLKEGEAAEIGWPSGMSAEALQVVKLGPRAAPDLARKAGVAIGKGARGKSVLVLAGSLKPVDQLALGALVRAYDYDAMRTRPEDEPDKGAGAITVMGAAREDAEGLSALAEGVFLTRDLVNAPSNVLTTTAFAEQLSELSEHGLKVRVLDEPELESLGMRTLLAVGQGSESPSKVVVMEWMGGGDEKPLALVGKGVVFDTGGISIKPAAGMEDMTMDMGGAGTVAGVMKTLALRKAKANVVGLVGLVENMPDGKAQRPGDVVRSMKGDTVEVINTDAEGRLVLCDVMWYAQQEYQPTAMIDLATLTGAIVIGLGHENAGVFSNSDALCDAFLAAAKAEGEGAWRMPLGSAYAKLLKSRIADVKNVGGRPAGSVTAAEFLHRFVKDETPWIHLDIAGVASLSAEGPHSPKGASGWGVLSLDRLIRDRFEGGGADFAPKPASGRGGRQKAAD